jgi:hypothetical protein
MDEANARYLVPVVALLGIHLQTDLDGTNPGYMAAVVAKYARLLCITGRGGN